eukprot:g16892.t2
MDTEVSQWHGIRTDAHGRLVKITLATNKLKGLGKTEDALRLVERVGDVRLKKNSWIMPPEAVVEAGLSAVKRYLVDVQETKNAGFDVTSLQLLKVVLVGSASAGKISLMRSIIAGEGTPTKGTPAEASTVDYAGMHRISLTRRAVYLLVADINKYLDVDDLDDAGSTVILVANKCDVSIDDFSETARRVWQRVGELLDVWHEASGLHRATPGPRRGSSSASHHDMPVIMRLAETRNKYHEVLFNGLAPKMPRDREVTLNWEFDKAGPPYGLVERLIVSCHVLGERVLTAKISGPLDDMRVWLAIRYVASAMVNLSREWPGVRWEGWLDCEARRPRSSRSSTTRAKMRLAVETDGVLRLVVEDPGSVLDTGKDPFESLPKEVEDKEDSMECSPEEVEDKEDPVACSCVHNAFFSGNQMLGEPRQGFGRLQ